LKEGGGSRRLRYEGMKVGRWEPEAKTEMGRESDQLIPEADGRRQREALAEGNVGAAGACGGKVCGWEGGKVGRCKGEKV